MALEDPSKRATVQHRATQFVKRLGSFGGLKLPTPSYASRSRSASMDMPRKPAFFDPSQPTLSEQHTGSGRSSFESLLASRSQDNTHKSGHSEPLWKASSDNSSTLHPPHHFRRPPGIVITQHLSNSRSESDLQPKRTTALVLGAPTVLRTPVPTALTPPSSTATTPASQGFADHSHVKALPALPQSSPRCIVHHQQDSAAYPHSNTAHRRVIAECDPGRDAESPAPIRTPLILPWTPPASIINSSLGDVPSGAISPMVLGSPIVTPPPLSLIVPHEPSIKGRPPPTSRLTTLSAPPLTPTSQLSPSKREVFDKEGHSLRLSPAIIQRPPPWPIKNLPSIPLTESTDSNSPTRGPFGARTLLDAVRQQVDDPIDPHRASHLSQRRPSPSRLSSMPALPMSGSVRPQVRDGSLHVDVDVEARASGDSLEQELLHDMDEDEIDELEPDRQPEGYVGPAHGRRPGSAQRNITGRPGPSLDSIIEANPPNRLGDMNLSPFNIYSFGWDLSSASYLPARTSLSIAKRPDSGYFSPEFQHNMQERAQTPHPSDFVPPNKNTTPVGRIEPPVAQKHRPMPLSPGGNDRKMQTHHPSRSMINLTIQPPLSASPVMSEMASKSTARDVKQEGSQHKRMSVARRQSMPSMTAVPPSYSPKPVREEEGREPLPPYSNSIKLIAQMPRKVEFTQPGVVSRDRKWRRVWCVLEGTKFSIYRTKGVKSVWEGVVGAGDGTVYRNRDSKGKAKEDASEQEGKVRKAEEESRAICEEERHSFSFARPRTSPATFTLVASPSSSPTNSHHFPSGGVPARSSGSGESSRSGALRPTRRPGSSSSFYSGMEPDRPDTSLLLREYTLQNAESGLGSDYKKRQNVIRVRMEGEQFLLQAKDVEDVVEWIEGFQAASDIALDLDERRMPRGPLFPRRRRRRRQATDAEAPASMPEATTNTS